MGPRARGSILGGLVCVAIGFWWSSSGSGGRGQDGCAGSSGVVGARGQVVFGVAGLNFLHGTCQAV